MLTESEVKGLSWEVPDDIGRVAAPECQRALVAVCACEAIADALVRLGESPLLDLQMRQMSPIILAESPR